MNGRNTIQQTRLVVLVLLIITALVTGGAYLVRRQYRSGHRTALPPRVPPNITQTQNFSLSKSEQGRTEFTVKAARVREQQEDGKSLLEDVEITTYAGDRISGKLCEYDPKAGKVHSQGQVEMELASLPGPPASPEKESKPATAPLPPTGPVFVKTSGVTFEEKTGIVSTEQPLEFRFSRGTGSAVGAVYDSRQQTLLLKSAVELQTEAAEPREKEPARRPGGAGKPGEARNPAESAPVFISANELTYARREGQVRAEGVRLRRPRPDGSRDLAADHGVLVLDDQNRVQAAEFTGNVRLNENVSKTKTRQARQSHIASDRLQLAFKEQVLSRAMAEGTVQADVLTESNRTRGSAARAELIFEGAHAELSRSLWNGNVRMVATPLGPAGEVRTLTTEVFEAVMKPGGRELDSARTGAPGRIEMVPVLNPAPQAAGRAPGNERRGSPSRRVLTAEALGMKFGDQDQIETLTAHRNARWESYPAPEAARPGARAPAAPPPQIATSDDLVAHFSKGSAQLENIEQSGHFHFTEGAREATAEQAHYTAVDEKIQLTGAPGRNPEVWDDERRTSARQITLDQKNDSGVADQDVRTVYLPREAAKSPTGGTPERTQRGIAGPLSARDPVYVIAAHMEANSRTGVTRYQSAPNGPRVRLWQNHDVIEARALVFDRDERKLTAEGQVATVLVESSTSAPARTPSSETRAPAGAPGAPARGGVPAAASDVRPIRITAETMVYTDSDHRAHYERQVTLRRLGTVVNSASLDAYLIPSDQATPGESRLERAVARGSVEIQDGSPGAERRAGAESAEYTTADEKMILSGGQPYVFDEQSGYTRGRQLTYYVRNDSIFVHGDASSRTFTEQRVKKRR
jgi:lipopolysaccharide export system protein LptA